MRACSYKHRPQFRGMGEEDSDVDEAREIQRDRNPGLADVACRQPGNFVEPIDDGVAVDLQPPRRSHKIEATFTPGDECLLEDAKIFLSR